MWRNIWQECQHFFELKSNFSRKEAKGATILLFFILIFPMGSLVYTSVFFKEADSSIDEKQKERLDSLVTVLESQQPLSREEYLAQIDIKPFNPNSLSLQEWQAIGVKEYLAKRIVNATSKGFKFRQKNDLAKIWGFPQEEYDRLLPYINLPDSFRRKKYQSSRNSYASKNYKDYDRYWASSARTSEASNSDTKRRYPKNENTIQAFDINTADTALLKQIRGIGDKLSQRIVKYRDGLGGFHNISQLSEVYGLNPEVVEKLSKRTFVSESFVVEKININQADYDKLQAHPYIRKKAAYLLVKYREQHGNYINKESILKSRAFKEAEIERLLFYIAF